MGDCAPQGEQVKTVAVRFGILGPTQVRLADGRDLALRGSRLRALLVLLLLDAPRVVPAQRLVDGLYGADPPGGAANALQSQVSRLRQALAAGGERVLVEFQPAGYRLAVDRDEFDAHRFVRLAADGRRALAAGDHGRAAALLRPALDLWRGAPLADVLDAPFARVEAARLAELRLGAVEDRVEAMLGLGGYQPLVAELVELVAAHPLRERLRGQLMRALDGSGRRVEALAAFEDARRVFAEELGADPSAELAAIHLAVLRGDQFRADQLHGDRSPHAAVSRLPCQLTSFVGRDGELRRVGELLARSRLVTLSGPGGVGKTRLALEAAGQSVGDVCLVELAACGAGADVPRAVLHALGLRDAGLRAQTERQREVTERLVAALAERRLLLIMDNCEHVVADAARLVDRLLRACPLLRVLATSREPLAVTGEALCPVSGLALPPEGTTVVASREYAAVRLFADRARDVAPDFAVTPATIDAVRHICRTLDGLPLAIELAAARLHALPVAEVAARLDDRFRLLSRGSRTAQPRHQTLRAVVQWSWELLDGVERVLARRLTVFAGGATLEAVERVCGLPTDETIDVLTSLVRKSWVEVADGRYRMLETVRAFCAERLAVAGEAEGLRRSHAAYLLDLAQVADPHLRRAEQLQWLRRLDVERDNLHLALRAAAVHGDVGMALRLVAALSFYWWLRGLRSEGVALAGEVLAAVGAAAPPELDEEFALCVLTASLGGPLPVPVDVSRVVGTGESIPGSLGRAPRQPFLLFLAAVAGGPPVAGPDSLVELLERQGELLGPDPWIHALSAIGLGLTWMYDGELERARREFTVALNEFRSIGDRWGMIMSLAANAELAYLRDDYAAAIEPMDEALQLAEELGSIIDMADLLRVRGDGHVRIGDLGRAHADYESAVEFARRAGAPETTAAALAGLGEVARLRGDLGAARRGYEKALSECPTGWFGAEATRSDIRVALGRIAQAAGDFGEARAWYGRALADTAGLRIASSGQAVEGLVSIELAGGDGRRGALLLGAATALLGGADPAGVLALAGVTGSLRRLLGDAAYESAFGFGASLTRGQALKVISGR